jgi:hypothetical protein
MQRTRRAAAEQPGADAGTPGIGEGAPGPNTGLLMPRGRGAGRGRGGGAQHGQRQGLEEEASHVGPQGQQQQQQEQLHNEGEAGGVASGGEEEEDEEEGEEGEEEEESPGGDDDGDDDEYESEEDDDEEDDEEYEAAAKARPARPRVGAAGSSAWGGFLGMLLVAGREPRCGAACAFAECLAGAGRVSLETFKHTKIFGRMKRPHLPGASESRLLRRPAPRVAAGAADPAAPRKGLAAGAAAGSACASGRPPRCAGGLVTAVRCMAEQSHTCEALDPHSITSAYGVLAARPPVCAPISNQLLGSLDSVRAA